MFRHLNDFVCCLLLGGLLLFSGVPLLLAGELLLSEKEKQWLARHPVIRVSVNPDSPPIAWISEAKDYLGISADLLKVIEQQLDVSFEIVPGMDSQDTLNKFINGSVDLISDATGTTRAGGISFGAIPYLELPGVIVSARNFKRLTDLAGFRVAVVFGGIWDDHVSVYDREMAIIRVEDPRTALELVRLGAADAAISDVATASYLLGKASSRDLAVVAYLDQKLELLLAVHEDRPELLGILRQTIAGIPESAREAIGMKWAFTDSQRRGFDEVYVYSLLSLLLVVLLMAAFSYYWRRAVEKRVAIRVHELKAALEEEVELRERQLISQFALGVAHGIKNPLAILQMGVDFFSGDAIRDETERAVLEDMGQSVCRMELIAQDLQILSRQKRSESEIYGFNELVKETVLGYQAQFESKGIEIVLELDSGVLPVLMDRKQLKEALKCLLSNALQAMESGGRLRIDSERKRLQPADMEWVDDDFFVLGDPVVWLDLSDSGSGISVENMNWIFDPFFSAFSQGEGIGLGLSIARNIVKLHEGSVDVRNLPQGGISVVMVFKIQEGGTG
ncbi:MAG: transporter substrate-binding domain-containing protein [Gammaproteobacteria bacterium]|nr:transporter substrate-binding domain-containing protein [Gammaproteobacteria bacterium]